jgi:peptide/nickel transport system permease protein
MAALPSDPLAISPVGGIIPPPIVGRRRGSWVRSLDVYIPGGFLVLLLLACFVWPVIYPVPAPVGGSILNANLGIGAPGHLLGTDTVGNDILSRLLYGGRVSFEIAAATQVLGGVVGSAIGIVSTYLGGFAEAVVMRLLDVLLAIPAVVLALAIIDGLGQGELNLIWAMSIFFIPAFARLARAATLSLKEQTFIVAAHLTGTKRWRAILRHIVPNVAPGLLTFALLNAGVAIIIEATLSFFGYGVPPPGPSWGNMIAEGQTVMSTEPRLILVPSILLLATVIALNMLGDGLRARWGVQ